MKAWNDEFLSVMATAGDIGWRKILKESMKHEDEELEDIDDVKAMFGDLQKEPDLAEEISEICTTI